MFNPQLDVLVPYRVEKIHNNVWIPTAMIDLKKGNLFRAFDEKNKPVLRQDGRSEFIAAQDAEVGKIGIAEVTIR
jgi:hypothetical protein